MDARKNATVEELAKIREAEATAQEAKVTKRAILDMYGTGLQNGVYWFPPVLRRAVYAALGLRVEVFGDRTVRAERSRTWTAPWRSAGRSRAQSELLT